MNLKTKKIKNNKGFSLIELLAAIVVLSIISVITIVGVTRYLETSKDQKVIQNKKNVSIAAELYLQANRDLLPKMIGESKRIQVSDLRKANYIKEDITNKDGEDCMKKSYVYVVKLSETDYSYNTVLVCGDEEPPTEDKVDPPYLEPINASDGTTKKIVFSKSSDVKTASFSFKLRGSQKDQTVGIYSYSYVIQGKTNAETQYTELYNSGVIDADKQPLVEFKSKSLNEYVDLAGVTNIRIKITALNENGGYLTYDETVSTEGQATGGSQYIDTEGPICPPVTEYGSRLGEPKTLATDEWISKRDIGTTRYPRIITLKCDDGNGSGCKRETFSEAWPNINKNPFGIMFGSITLEDNNVMNEKGKKKDDSNKTECDINVFVDLQAPTVEITPINPKTGQVVGENIELFGEKVPDHTTITVADPTDTIKEDVVNPTLTILSTNYKNMYNLSNPAEGWLNSEFYPKGIKYKVHVKDNIYLDSVTWETNEPYYGSDWENILDVSLNHSDSFSWKRNELSPDDPMYINEQALLDNKETITPEQNEIEIVNENGELIIGFYDEGARYGVLTAKDKAGNETKIYVHANLDRTAPLMDEGIYDLLSYDIFQINDDYEPEPYYEEDTDPENELKYVPEGNPWHINPKTGLPDGFAALEQTEKYKHFSNLYSCWPCGGGGGYGLPEGVYLEAKEMSICTAKTANGYGIIPGTNYTDAMITSQYGRERTGCYKIGVTEGDNQYSALKAPDYMNDEVFKDIVKNREYKSGTWSNQELVCGPHDNNTYDNFITIVKDGKLVRIENPNGSEISKWGGMRIKYYKQVGIKQDPKDEKKVVPVTDTEPQTYIISKRDRSEWPVFKDQGTHRLVWSNCDSAGNCTGESLSEYIKIDTIAPQCNNSVKYDNNLNSDGGTGPNHNGWLYDFQTATVSHDCADTSKTGISDYFQAYARIKAVTEYAKEGIWEYYDEFGSGCTTDYPTDETMVYDDDVYTCEAGTQGIGEGYLGQVSDYAGNVRECTVGATIRKDTTPPLCVTQAHYSGKNGDGNYNAANHHNWAMKGMSIYTSKTCEDTFYSRTGNYPGKAAPAISGCSKKDDYKSNGTEVRVAEKSDFQFSKETIEKYKKNGTQDYWFKPDNATTYEFEDDVDILGKIGASGAVEVDGELVYKTGYIVDRAGNISDEQCVAAEVKRDIEGPGCKNDVVSPNNMYAEAPYTQGRAKAWTTEESYNYDNDTKWFGMSGKDGMPEYAQVQKGCDDVPKPNYPGFTYPEYVKAGCSDYEDSNTEVWYYGYKPGQSTNISHVDLYETQTFNDATYQGPSDKVIKCSDEVYDDAGNHGGGTAAPVSLNIDYIAPVCGPVQLVKGSLIEYAAGPRRFFSVGNRGFDSAKRNTEIYVEGSLTNKAVTPTATCDYDEGSGCLPYNGRVQIGGVEYKSWDSFVYKGKDSDQYTAMYAFDVARNKTKCETTFSLKQDTTDPVIGACTFRATYSRDGASDSFLEVVVSGINDPLAAPDNFASGVDMENSYLNTGFRSLDPEHQGHWQNYFYFDEEKGDFNFSDGNDSRWYYTLKNFTTSDGDVYSGTYARNTWHSFFPSNERLIPNKARGKNVTKRVIDETTFYVKSPLTCTTNKSKPFPIVILYDYAGNWDMFECTPETPADDITIPACCDETVGDVSCTEWKWTDCSKKCDTGEKHEERTCTAESKYRDNKMCSWLTKQNEGTKCNEMACCSKKDKSCSACSNDFDTQNPCSFGQKECVEKSVYDDRVTCVQKHIETCQNDEDLCQSEIEKARNQGDPTAIAIGKQIEEYLEEEQRIWDDEEEREIPLEKVIRDGKIVPFEYEAWNKYGTYRHWCDLDTAKEYLKDEYKDVVTDCSQLEEAMFNVDASGKLFKETTLYNYVASPSSCQIYIDGQLNHDWVAFKSTDPENCKIENDVDKTESNCKQTWINDISVRSFINKMGSYDINGQTQRGCNINITWRETSFTFQNIDSRKYRKQNYVAVKCLNKSLGRYEYCMESCGSGICVPGELGEAE